MKVKIINKEKNAEMTQKRRWKNAEKRENRRGKNAGITEHSQPGRYEALNDLCGGEKITGRGRFYAAVGVATIFILIV